MLAEIKERFRGKYPMGSAKELEEMEQALLYYDSFDSKEALVLGSQVIRQSEKYGEDMVVRIIRQRDHAVIFQYLGDACGQRNLDFAEAKQNTVIKTGHCSLWALVQEETVGGLDMVFSEDSECLPAGGAFPIYEKGKIVAILTTSGLHEGNDHRVVVAALCVVRRKSEPPFHGLIV